MEIEGMKILGLSPDQENYLQARGMFDKAYREKRGWPADIKELTIDQIIEIRSQDGWKNPVIAKAGDNQS